MASTNMQTEPVLGLDEEPDKLITLVAKDESTRDVKYGALMQSKMLAAALEGDPNATRVHVTGVRDRATLAHVIEFLEHHYGKPPTRPIAKPLTSVKMADVCEDKWDAEFVDNLWGKDSKKEREDFLEIISAANYLNVPPLLELLCARMGAAMRGKDAKGIFALFGIVKEDGPEKRARTGEAKAAADEEADK